MPFVRRAYALLIVCSLTANLASAAEPVVLSLDDFAKRAVENSLRSRSINETLASERYSYQATRRQRTWPQFDLTASKRIDASDNDAGTETDGRNATGKLSLEQPFLTGAELSVSAEVVESRSETRFNDVSTSIFETRTRPQYLAEIRQPIPLFVGLDALRTWRRNTIDWDRDQIFYRGNVLDLMSDARALYFRLILQIESLAVEQKKFESSELVRRTTRSLVRAGKLPEVELIRTDIRANRDFRRIQNARNALDKSLNEAKNFLQIPAAADIRLTSNLVYEPFRMTLPALVKEALENNPTVRAARLDLRLSEITLTETREGDRPSFSTFANYTLTRDRSDEDFPRDPTGWTAGVSMSWPIFDATLTRLRTRRAELALNAQRRTVEDRERLVRLAVENTFIDLKRAEDQIKAFRLERESAQRNLKAMRLRYENGLTRLTDVFDAENESRDLELEYLSLLVDYNSKRDQLLVLIGRDLIPMKGVVK